MEQAEEFKKALELAAQGNWIPLTIIVALFGVLFTVLFYIAKNVLKRNEEDHKSLRDNYIKLEEIMDKALDNQSEIAEINSRFEVKIETNEKNIKENRSDIKDLIKG